MVSVNLANERATVEYDPALITQTDIIGRIEQVGYSVATARAEFRVRGLADDNDARALQRAFGKMEYVTFVVVSFLTERAVIDYIPTLASQGELRRAAKAAGFEVVPSSVDWQDAERKVGAKEIIHQRHLLRIGLVFAIPTFVLSMSNGLVCCQV